MTKCGRFSFYFVMTLLTLCAIGCGPNRDMRKMNVRVTVDPSLNPGGPLPSMDVDLVGVAPAEKARWERYHMSEYWQAQSNIRANNASRTKTLSFGPSSDTQTMAKNDEMWNKWKALGAKDLFVLVNLPGAHKDEDGDADHRRRILPLEYYRWSGDQIDITIKSDGPQVETPMNPPKQ